VNKNGDANGKLSILDDVTVLEDENPAMCPSVSERIPAPTGIVAVDGNSAVISPTSVADTNGAANGKL
jgi:hypothetical protein